MSHFTDEDTEVREPLCLGTRVDVMPKPSNFCSTSLPLKDPWAYFQEEGDFSFELGNPYQEKTVSLPMSIVNVSCKMIIELICVHMILKNKNVT